MSEKNEALPRNISGIVLYFDSFFENATFKSLKGFSLLCSFDDYVQHRYYQVKDDRLIEDINLRAKMGKFISRDFRTLLTYTIKVSVSSPSYLVIRNQNYFDNLDKLSNRNELSEKIINDIASSPSRHVTNPSSDNECENDGCLEAVGGCEEDGEGGLICRFCARSSMEASLSNQEIKHVFYCQ